MSKIRKFYWRHLWTSSYLICLVESQLDRVVTSVEWVVARRLVRLNKNVTNVNLSLTLDFPTHHTHINIIDPLTNWWKNLKEYLPDQTRGRREDLPSIRILRQNVPKLRRRYRGSLCSSPIKEKTFYYTKRSSFLI